MSTSNNCKESASKSNNDLSDAIGCLRLLNIKDNNATAGNVCANCGKEGDDNMNTCNKCKQVKYCNAVCKKVHKKKHKKKCEEHVRLVADHTAKLHDIELFKQQPPQEEDCPICFLRLPTLGTGSKYQTCCGKVICSGCVYAPVYDDQGNEVDNEKCPFCRAPPPFTQKEAIERAKKRFEVDDDYAVYRIGCCYREGMHGYPQDHNKALELYHRAAELGHATAYCSIGYAYQLGQGVEVDNKKAMDYYELGAIRGDADARYNLGTTEEEAGNVDRAVKHYMIATVR